MTNSTQRAADNFLILITAKRVTWHMAVVGADGLAVIDERPMTSELRFDLGKSHELLGAAV